MRRLFGKSLLLISQKVYLANPLPGIKVAQDRLSPARRSFACDRCGRVLQQDLALESIMRFSKSWKSLAPPVLLLFGGITPVDGLEGDEE
jgi:hypothetical protein